MQIGENAEAWPLGLLGGGEHFADIDGGIIKHQDWEEEGSLSMISTPGELIVQEQQCYNML